MLGRDGDLGAYVSRTVPFEVTVSVSWPRRLTTGVSCLAWGIGASRGAAGEFECCSGATFMVGPLVPSFDPSAWVRS